jgi:1,4-alpha-glucan branching enzyme
MYGQAAKKLLFMGGEIGQRAEWNHDQSLDWHLLEHESHAGVQRWVRDLNRLYRSEPALHELDCDPDGFQWVDCNDADRSLLSFLRRGSSTGDVILVACNFTPIARHDYRLGVPRAGWWREALNSDAKEYWGQGFGNLGGVEATPDPSHGHPYSVAVTLPPLAVVFFKSGASERRPARQTAPESEKMAVPKKAARRERGARKKGDGPRKGSATRAAPVGRTRRSRK